MKAKISSMTLRELPESIDQYLKRYKISLKEYMIRSALEKNPTERTRWLIDHCEEIIVERIKDPFADDKFGLALAECPVIDLYGIIRNDEKKIVEFKLRFDQ